MWSACVCVSSTRTIRTSLSLAKSRYCSIEYAGSTTRASPPTGSPIRYEAQPRSSSTNWRNSTIGKLTASAARFLEVLVGRAFLLVVLVALVLPAAARAHASLVRADPADGTVLSAAPKSVRFFFDDDVRLVSGVKAVRNGGGSVLRGQPHIAG